MKKAIIIIGTFILFIISVATLFKLLYWPGSGPLLVIGITLFAALYLPLFFIQRMLADKKALNIAVSVLGLLSTNMIFVGVMFKIMHWPGSAAMLISGTFLFIFPTLILYIVQQFKEYDRKFSEFWRMVLVAILCSIFFVFWSDRPSRNIILNFLKIEDAMLRANESLKKHNNSVLNKIKEATDSIESSKDVAMNIHDQSLGMIDYVEQLKRILINNVEFDTIAFQNHWNINSLDNMEAATYYLGAESEFGKELLKNLTGYKIFLKNELIKLQINEQVIEEYGDFGTKTGLNSRMQINEDQQWTANMFNNQPVAAALALLSNIQNEVLNAESTSLNLIIMNVHK